MTAEQLIAELSKYPQDAEILLNGSLPLEAVNFRQDEPACISLEDAVEVSEAVR